MKYYIISGEPSGDLHGSNLMKELKLFDTSAEFRVWGGDLMEKEGGKLAKHYRDLAFMGFVEVVQNLRTILKNISYCKNDISDYNPDVVILIDYPGFNLRIAKYAKLSGYKVCYYISPSIWAWRKSRIKIIRKYIDRMYVILPFEKQFYQKLNYDVEFVGHPLLDSIKTKREKITNLGSYSINNKKKIIAILPGSRKQEIKRMLPVMLELCQYYPGYQFVIAGAPGITKSYYLTYIKDLNVPVVFDSMHELLSKAVAAIVTSGTATLEAAIFKVPEVVCYKGGAISYMIARMIVTVDYISLPNLIMEKEIVKELIQKSMTVNKIKTELDALLFDNEYRNEMLISFDQLEYKLGGKGASRKLAQKITGFLKSISIN